MRPVALDAQDRARRTFVAGLCIDVLLAVAGTLAITLTESDIAWTGVYWAALGTLLAKTVLSAGASYVLRYYVAPAFQPDAQPDAKE